MGPRDITALLFDLDGTIVDTRRQHYEASRIALAECGVGIDQAFYDARIEGAANAEITASLFPDAGAPAHAAYAERKEALYRELMGELVAIAGAEALLGAARASGIRLALVTNAPGPNVELVLARLGLEGAFDTIVLGDSLPRAKPDPLPYTVALDRLDCAAGEAIGFEDSLAGVVALKAADVTAVAVATSRPETELLAAGADLVVADFEAPALAGLAALSARLGRWTGGTPYR